MSNPENHLYEFGRFRLDLSERQLFRDGEPVSLTPKAFEILVALVRKSGHVVEKNDLLKEVWADTFVEEANLSRHVWMLRKTLGESPGGEKFIETVPRRGYRFTAQVKEIGNGSDHLVVERHSITHVIAEEDDGEIAAPPHEMAQAFEQPRLAASSKKQKWAHWRWGLAFGVLCALMIGLAALYRARTSREAKASDTVGAATFAPRSIAVLPFKTIGTESDTEYLGLGMADALITRLGNVGQIAVRPTSAVRKYLGVEKEPMSAGQELKVESVLEGSIQRSGDRIRVTVQLIRVSDGAQVWADKFDDQFTNVFAVQDSISEKMAEALQLKLTNEEQKRLSKRYTENIEAYQLYLKGRYYWDERTPEVIKQAIEYFNRAIEIDPSYALAYSGLADCYNLQGLRDGDPRGAFPKAKAMALKALEIDDTLAEAHASLGFVKHRFDWDFAGAEKEFKRALDLNRNYATAHQWYAFYFASIGKYAESIEEMRRAQELDPLSLEIKADLGLMLSYARQYDQAIAQLERTVALDPNFAYAHYQLGKVYRQKGMVPEAIAELKQARLLAPEKITYLSNLTYIYAVSGQRGEAQRLFDQLQAMLRQRHDGSSALAIVYLGFGDKDKALELLDKSYEERSSALALLKAEPLWDSLRSDPRFQELMSRVGLAK